MAARILIVGAGEAGRELVGELRRLAARPEIVGFLDDDPAKAGQSFETVPVLGKVEALAAVVAREKVDEVVVSVPSATGEFVRRVIAACRDSKVRLRMVPRLVEVIQGHVRWDQVGAVRPEDLLGRTVVRHDLERARERLQGKKILVSGAAGSIGSELAKQLVLLQAGALVFVDANENGMFQLREELRALGTPTAMAFEVANLRDEGRLRRIFAAHTPGVVFHAAAYKHVPLMEAHPDEAVLNNVMGTRNLASLALEFGCEDFVLVSTDKAVNPTSVMGCTKRIAEKLVQSLAAQGRTRFVAVRFGNVLGSAGSVIPTFKQQIERGGPVTVTHPEMIRYFMTIPEAAQLIIQAWALGENGEIFVLDMGEPVRIYELAEQMIRLHGFEPGQEIPIQITGLRPGEKLYEELLTAAEKVRATRHEKIFVSREEERFDARAFVSGVAGLIETAKQGDHGRLRAQLRDLVPTYQPAADEERS